VGVGVGVGIRHYAAGMVLASRDKLRGVRDAIAATRNGRTAGIELTEDELLEFAKRGIKDPTDRSHSR
jgi:hypothetical protein